MTMTRIAFVFCATSIMAFAQTSLPREVAPMSPTPNQTIDYIDGYPTTAFDFQNFWNYLEPLRVQLTEPASPVPATINVAPLIAAPPPFNTYTSMEGVIYAPTSPCETNEGWNGPDYVDMTHEWMHQSLPPYVFEGQDPGIHEGLASGKVDLIYLNLRKQNPSLFPADAYQPSRTCSTGIDMWNTRKPDVFGGAGLGGWSNFYANNVENGFNSPCTLLALFINKLGGTFRPLDHAINQLLPGNREQFLALVDQFGIEIDGVKPSTFFRRDITNYAGAPSGQPTFGLASLGDWDPNYSEPEQGMGNWPFNPEFWFTALVQFTTGADGTQYPSRMPGWVTYSVVDSSGKIVVSQQTVSLSVGIIMRTAGFPNGTYQVNACSSDANGTCQTGSRMQDSDVFPVLNEELNPGDVAVIANKSLTLLSPDPGSVSIETYPGMTIFRSLPQNPDGSFVDITVTDGMHVRTFTPDMYSPTARKFKLRDYPIVNSINRATDFVQTTSIAPGEIATLFGWSLTNNDPSAAAAFPITTEGCAGTSTNDQGRTEIVFTTGDGVQYKAPILYCGFDQMNFRVPLELPVGQTVTAVASSNGVESSPTTLTVTAAAPGMFGYDPNTVGVYTAIATFATGPKTGQLIGVNNPVHAGDIVSLFGTGLGPGQTSEPDGTPCPGANQALAGVLVTLGSTPANVLYAGCAPGFAGLDQINFAVPEGITSSGAANLVITAGGIASAPATLPAQ